MHIPRKKRFIHVLLAFVTVIVLYQLLVPFYTDEFDYLSYRRISDTSKANIDAFKANSSPDVIRFYEKFKYDTSLEYPTEYDLQEDFFKIKYGSNKGEYWDQVKDVKFYDSDPRLEWSVLAYDLMQGNEKSDDKIPFAWYDWIDSHDYNKLLSLKENKVDCEFLFHNAFPRDKLRLAEGEIGERLFSYDRDSYDNDKWYERAVNNSDGNVILLLKKHYYVDPSNWPTSNKLGNDGNGSLTDTMMSYDNGVATLDLFDKVRPEVYQLQARSYVINTLVHPLSITIMNSDKESYQYLVDRDSRKNIITSGRLQRFIDSHGPETPRKSIKFDHINKSKQFVESDSAKEHKVVIDEIIANKQRQSDDSMPYVVLNENDFEFDAIAKIKELEVRSDDLTPHEKSYLDSLKFSTSFHYAFAPKYFLESSHVQSFKKYGNHFDKRFFNGPLIADPFQMEMRLDSLIRNYQKFVKANGLISWLAHGTMYGWMYNGRTFPWDNDADMQMPIKHLNLLAQHFNQTVVLEDPSEGNGKFLIDVSSSITTRVNGNGFNNIDARFIDLDSGLYVDITGLSVSSTPIFDIINYYKQQSKNVDVNDIKFKDPNLIEGKTDFTLQELLVEIDKDPKKYPNNAKKDVNNMIQKWEKLKKKKVSIEENLTPEQRYNMHHQLQIYNCRNFHFVNLNMINPLVKTVFHGVPALVPEKYVKVLKNEYKVSNQYGFLTYKTNSFVPEFGSWISVSDLSTLMNKNQNDPKLKPVYEPINSLKIDDVYKLLENMATSGYSLMLSTIHNALSLNAYRVKELDITYDKDLSRDEKLDLLDIFRNKVGTTLTASQKDPWLHGLELRIWNELTKERPDDCSNARSFVDNKKAYEIWDSLLKASEGSNPMFRVFTSERSPVESAMITDNLLDFNKVGSPVYLPGKSRGINIFKSDPQLLDN